MSTAQPITHQGTAEPVGATDTKTFGIVSLVLGVAWVAVVVSTSAFRHDARVGCMTRGGEKTHPRAVSANPSR